MRALRVPLSVLSLLLTVVALLAGLPSQVPAGQWASTGSLEAPREGAAAVLLPDGRVLIIGGRNDAGPLATIESYGVNGVFASAPAMHLARSGHTATVLLDGRVLVTGGETLGEGSTNSAEIFDPAANIWSFAGSLLEARAGHTATRLEDGRVLIAGGGRATLEIYDPAKDSFSYAGSLSAPRSGHAAAVLARWPAQNNRLIDRQVIFVGGFDGSNVLSSTEIYDPATGQVSAGPTLPGPRQKASAVTVLGGYVYVAGGNDGAQDLSSALLISRDGVVSAAADLLQPRSGHIAVRLPGNNSVLIAGGSGGSSAEIYIPWQNQQVATGSMSAPHSAGASASVGRGLYLVAGGSDSASAELYGYVTVETDKNDYAPGETVTITGSGWEPGEAVLLVLHEDVAEPLHDDHVINAVADANGSIFDSSFAPEPHDSGVRFFLTASGNASGQQARTTFTDGTPIIQSVVDSPFSPNQASSVGVRDTIQINARNQNSGTVADFRIRIHAGSTAGALVKEFLQGSVSGNTNTSATWNGKDTGGADVADGTYVAVASNGTTETTSPASQTGVIVVDNTNPTVTLLSPANGATVSGNFKLEASPLDVGGNDSNIDKVEFYVDSLLVGTDSGAGGGWNSGNLSAGSFGNGSHTWFARAFDNAGNNADSASRTFNIGAVDTDPPTVNCAVPNQAIWYGSDVTVNCTASDGGSGLANPADASFNLSTSVAAGTETPSASTGSKTVCDNAGNCATAGPYTFKVDKKAPGISFNGQSPSKNGNGWNNSDVTLEWSCTDGGSGVVSATVSQTISSEGTSQQATGTCEDLVGNTASSTDGDVNIDKTAPTASASPSPAPNANGWNNTDVTVSFSGSDALSGIDFCDADVVLSSEGAGQSASGTCTDKAGNVSAPATASGINIDKTAPVIAFVSRTPANGFGWNNSDVTVNWSCNDSLSGPVAASVSQIVMTEGAGQSSTGTCYDLAGNSASDTQSGINIDKTAPSLSPSVAPNPVVLNGSATASPGASDALSGIDTASCGAVDTSSVGLKSVACTASDKAGNSSNASASYNVIYAPVGTYCLGSPGHQILQPINADGTSVFKQKSTVPAKFRVCDANGLSIGTAGVVTDFKIIAMINGTVTATNEEAVTSTTPDTTFRWDPSDQQWIFNINTKSLSANRTYVFRISLNDGTFIDFQFGMK